MKTQRQITGKTIKQLVNEGILTKVDPFSKERDVFEQTIRMTDGYKKLYGILIANKLEGSEKQIEWAEKIRESKADALSFKIISMSVTNEFGGDIDVNTIFAKERKCFAIINSGWWIENRF